MSLEKMIKEIMYLGYLFKITVDETKTPIEFVVEVWPRTSDRTEFMYKGTHLTNNAFNCLRDIKNRLKGRVENGKAEEGQ